MITGTLTYTPLASGYRVRRIPPNKETAGGIYLPDEARHVPEEAEVLAAGPGAPILDTGYRTLQQCTIGDRVVFFKYDLLVTGEEEGRLTDEQLIAVLDEGSGDYEPLGEWVKVEPPQLREADGLIAVPEAYRTKLRHARVTAVGPGRIYPHGKWVLSRLPVRVILGLKEGESLVGKTVCWRPTARLEDMRQPSGRRCLFVQAGDILALLET